MHSVAYGQIVYRSAPSLEMGVVFDMSLWKREFYNCNMDSSQNSAFEKGVVTSLFLLKRFFLGLMGCPCLPPSALAVKHRTAGWHQQLKQFPGGQFIVGWILASKMGAMLLYLAIILARANAYSRASATLRLSGTVIAIAPWNQGVGHSKLSKKWLQTFR